MSLLCISMSAASGVVYVKDGGTGDGRSASSPLGSMLDAYNALGTDGGTIVVCGGTFYDEIALAFLPRGTYSGTYDVVINGGDFSHLIAICGGEGLDGTLVSSLSYGTKVDLEAPEKGDITFTNYHFGFEACFCTYRI